LHPQIDSGRLSAAGLERFLTPEQLKKWDTEVAKAKEFLGFAAA